MQGYFILLNREEMLLALRFLVSEFRENEIALALAPSRYCLRLCVTVVELRKQERMSIHISSLHTNMALWHLHMR